MFKKAISIMILSSLLYSCQEEITIIQQEPPSPTVNQNTKSPAPSAIPSLKPEEKPSDSESNDLDQNDKEVVGTETEAVKTNFNWKEFNPVIKGRKYIYNYVIKEGSTDIKTDTTWEIISVNDKSYVVRQSFNTSGDNKLRSNDVIVNLNSDYSPPTIPPVSVGGEKIADVKKVQISEKAEKINVLGKEYEAVKVTSDNVTNWYGKNVGLVKSIISGVATYTLELKEYK